MSVDLASKLYSQLDSLNAPRSANCRLHLPCLAFPVTEIRRSRARNQKVIYEVKANRPPSRQALLLVYSWDRDLLEQPNSVDDTQNPKDHVMAGECESSQSQFIKRVRQPVSSFFGSLAGPVDSKSHLRALRLIIRLGWPFRAFSLVQQRRYCSSMTLPAAFLKYRTYYTVI